MAKQAAAAGRDPSLQEVTAALEEEIALGYLSPRERLVEEEIAERLGIKRHVARQALLDLQTMGLVVRQPNRGATVRDFTAEEVEQLWVVRQLLEGAAVEILPLPAAPELIAKLREIHARHGEAVDQGDLRTVFRENLLFHKTLFAACGNAPLVRMIEQLALASHGIRSYAVGHADVREIARREHGELIDLLETERRAELVDLVKRHLEPSKEVYLRMTRTKRAR